MKISDLLKSEVVTADDKRVGRVSDVFVDDLSWKIRFLSITTGPWFNQSETLLTPQDIVSVAASDFVIHTSLPQTFFKEGTKRDLSHDPTNADESRFLGIHGWPAAPVDPLPLRTDFGSLYPEPHIHREHEHNTSFENQKPDDDPHLLRFTSMRKYSISSVEGNVGHLEDLTYDSNDWTVHKVIIDTRSWIPGNHIPIAIESLTKIESDSRHIQIELTQDEIKESPEFGRSA